MTARNQIELNSIALTGRSLKMLLKRCAGENQVIGMMLFGPLDTKNSQSEIPPSDPGRATKLFAREEFTILFFIASSNQKAFFIVAYAAEPHVTRISSRDLVRRAEQMSDIPEFAGVSLNKLPLSTHQLSQ